MFRRRTAACQLPGRAGTVAGIRGANISSDRSSHPPGGVMLAFTATSCAFVRSAMSTGPSSVVGVAVGVGVLEGEQVVPIAGCQVGEL